MPAGVYVGFIGEKPVADHLETVRSRGNAQPLTGPQETRPLIGLVDENLRVGGVTLKVVGAGKNGSLGTRASPPSERQPENHYPTGQSRSGNPSHQVVRQRVRQGRRHRTGVYRFGSL